MPYWQRVVARSTWANPIQYIYGGHGSGASSLIPHAAPCLTRIRTFSTDADDENSSNSNNNENDEANSLTTTLEDEGKVELESNDGAGPESSDSGLIPATVPDYYPDILAVPVSRRPVFPGFYKTITVRDPQVAAALTKALKTGRPYVGLFLAKDESEAPSNENGKSIDSSPDTIKDISKVHSVGVFAKIINVIPMPSSGNSSSTTTTSSPEKEKGDAEETRGTGLTAIVYPHRRIRAIELISSPEAPVSRLRTENVLDVPYDRRDRTIRAICQEIFATLADVAKLNAFFREHITHHNVPASVFEEAGRLADFVAVLSGGEASELQSVLEEVRVEDRLRHALLLLKKELVTAQLQHSISKEVEQRLSQKQREYFLHEQLKAIKKELGLETESKEKLLQQFNERVAKLTLPEAIQRTFDEEINKLAVLEPAGAEFNVTRNYLDWLTLLPWGIYHEDCLDVDKAARILDEDHYGLENVKERILEFIAVGKLQKESASSPKISTTKLNSSEPDQNPSGPSTTDKTTTTRNSSGDGRGKGAKILCLIGPPGVGKTSIGRSVARALGRAYYRFSVGGLADVAEIKGHRRTYVGAMPGKIIQALRKVQSSNPLILIDEVDKIAGRGGIQGDPASALLELLDPEQNSAFLDHYLDVPVDLSSVLFMCTANTTDTIPAPLLDRMEVVRLSGYVAEEKLHIARRYLTPQALETCGLTESQVQVTEGAILQLIRQYCRESGVRNLKRQIEKIYRKAALKIVKQANAIEKTKESANRDNTLEIEKNNSLTQSNSGEGKTASSEHNTIVDKIQTPCQNSPLIIEENNLKDYVGIPLYLSERLYGNGEYLPQGVATGLAWTPLGGSVLYMECIVEGKSKNQVERTLSNESNPSAVPAKASLIRTGQLGEVMKESSSIAYSYAKSFIHELQPTSTFFDQSALHLHVPEGATPKDGPSAGCTMATALLSLALGKGIRADLGMTGELTLTGQILRIGGVREKVVAAKRADLCQIILPRANLADWEELPEYIREGIKVQFVDHYREIAQLLGWLQ